MMLRSFRVPLVAVAVLGTAVPASAEIKTCKTGQIVMGNPKYKGMERPAPSGSMVKADPPLGVRSMVFAGQTMYTSNGQEIWSADLASGAVKRIAGEHQKAATKFNDGPCPAARFTNVHGMTLLPDGSLVAADYGVSALVRIESPGDPAKCKVSYFAGTSKPVEGTINDPGEADGPGATAKLQWPEWPAADAAGNVYVIDSTTSKLRKVAADAQRTVSTVATLPTEGGLQAWRGLTVLKDKLYSVNNTTTAGVVFEIDPKTGKARKVFEGTYKQFVEIPQNTTPALSAITTDGSNLFITGSGFIWKLTPAGKLTHVAGKGNPTDIPKTYDLKAAHPAKDLLLRVRTGDSSTMGTTAALAYADGQLYFRGREDGVYVVRLDCK